MSNKLAQRVHFVSTLPTGEDFLQQLRRVNGERWKAWAQSDEPDPLYMSNEFGGEAGEVQNVVKKLVRESRGWKGSRASVAQLGDEIADCIICLDSLARAYGLHLAEIISSKFNATSEANGFEHRLGAAQAPSHKCGMCEDTGYKDYPGFAMDPCDHQTAPAAETEKLSPANPAALERSIASVDEFMESDDSHMLTPEHGESIMLCIHELKRLRSLPIPAADEVDWDEIRSAVAEAAWPSSDLVDEAMTRIRAAIAALQAKSAEPAGEKLDHEALLADKARLDYLDRCNAALNAHYGTTYSWKLIQSHNVNRLMLGISYDVDLNDSQPNGLPSCRDAIDERMRNAGRAAA